MTSLDGQNRDARVQVEAPWPGRARVHHQARIRCSQLQRLMRMSVDKHVSLIARQQARGGGTSQLIAVADVAIVRSFRSIVLRMRQPFDQLGQWAGSTHGLAGCEFQPLSPAPPQSSEGSVGSPCRWH